jgi:hypothetical protein
MSTGERTATGTLISRYDDDEAFRAQVTAMYMNDRPRFISSLIALAFSLGATRPEAVEFANAVTRRIRTAG